MRKISIAIILLLTFAFIFASLAASYVGSAKSNKYHYSSCEWAQKINPQSLVRFNSTKEARAAGYVACKVCRPPADD